ncbi:MAG TPA: 2-oxoglutarate dehydrogenase E1 component [Ktedonobacteraceae bacterium]|nr:2-oxoglutarate dehydrogenase E1 component [Ktedonobacteraceae bacterium]
MYDLDTFYGPNAGYVLELYERYRQNPSSVDPDSRAVFDSWSPASVATLETPSSTIEPTSPVAAVSVSTIVAATNLAYAIRSRGHLGAHLDPLGSEPLGDPALLTETHGIRDEDLALLPPEIVGGHSAEAKHNALEAITALRAMYSGTISYEFDQVKSPDERLWLRDAVGLQLYRLAPGRDIRYKLLQRLTQVEAFEHFLHTTFPGQKRFSLEGTDVLVPMIDEIIGNAVKAGTHEVIIGMAHRGRLNVLAHVLEKPYTNILSEFRHMKHEEGVPLTDTFGFGYTGDVKYHLGAEHVLGEEEGADIDLKITLSPNPSHLEFVNPVVEGMTRASQEIRTQAGSPGQDVNRTMPILIHGDAAFPGEGIVAETLNLWNLQGYRVGGTIHIIVNNQLGFTTEPRDYRSTHFASDLAKGFEIPIIHVNADDPEASLMAVRMAYAYRDRFNKDILVDLVGYRRWGHNEGDEPAFTQPQMYEVIRTHPGARELYAQRLQEQGIISLEDVDAMQKRAIETLEQSRREADENLQPLEEEETNGVNGHYEEAELPPPVSAGDLISYNTELLNWPEGFSPNSKLARLLQRRATTLGAEGGIDWGQAEALAFASILADGTSIRLTGQDSERGTFSHRHAVLHDQQSGALYIPLQHLSQARANFSIFNSPLNESASLGFEYGYSVHAPDVLTLWEAQFGDFANVAQVIIDQFIASARAKWKQPSSLVLLLPHGYEGQGPEHSSARLERYLELSAQDNWRVASCSTAAQYFHLLRLQAFYLHRYARPLVVMTPKSLLRHPLAAANLRELAEGTFHPVLNDYDALQHADTVRRVALCTGKVAIDLLSNAGRAQAEDVAVARVELLYPFPENELQQALAQYPNAHEVVWVQEEPENMGAWGYMAPRLAALLGSKMKLRHISRPARSSPATGFSDLFQLEQEQIIEQTLHTSAKIRSV